MAGEKIVLKALFYQDEHHLIVDNLAAGVSYPVKWVIRADFYVYWPIR